MNDHEGKRHYHLAAGLIGNHSEHMCFEPAVRCDHERATVHALLAQAHALASIAGSLEKITRQISLTFMVPEEDAPASAAEVAALAESIETGQPIFTDDDSIASDEAEVQVCGAYHWRDTKYRCTEPAGHAGRHWHQMDGFDGIGWSEGMHENDSLSEVLP